MKLANLKFGNQAMLKKLNWKKFLVLTLVFSLVAFSGALYAQEAADDNNDAENGTRMGPPDHAQGPPDHAGPPDDAGRPDDAGPDHDEVGPPEHANVPDHVRDMIEQRRQGRIGPPDFAPVPDFVREIIFGERVTDAVYSVGFEEENELEGVEINIYEENEEGEKIETVTTGVYGEAEVDLSDGGYDFTATKAGYEDYDGSFEVDGDDKTIEFEMVQLEVYFKIHDLFFVDEDGDELDFENGAEFAQGDEVNAKVTIKNLGEEEGTQDIVAYYGWVDENNGENEETIFDGLDIGAGDETTEEFDFTIDENAETGEVELEVKTEDDAETLEFKII